MPHTGIAAINTEMPPLATGLTSLLPQRRAIDSWLSEHESKVALPPYASVDLRYAGYKIAPVDTNLFPAGFNNLSPEDYPAAIAAFTRLRENHRLPTNLLLLAESHSRNIHYWQNIAVIQQLMQGAGFNMKMSAMLSGLPCSKTLSLPSGTQITLDPICIDGHQITIKDATIEGILLNRDMAEGVPSSLLNITQPFFPPLNMGWHQRLKSQYFRHYQMIARQFATDFNLTHWLIDAIWQPFSPINFANNDQIPTLHATLQTLFNDIEQHYTQESITLPTFVMLKADAGTYGQAVIAVHHPDDILQLNQSLRRSMLTTKGKQPVNAIILQEGVYSSEYFAEEKAIAEPVIYLIDNQIAGGFYRAHAHRDNNDNLNRPGMFFKPFPITTILTNPSHPAYERCYLYSIIAKLAGLAAAYEIKEAASHDD